MPHLPCTMNQTMVSQAPSAALRPAKCRTIFLSMARGEIRLTTSNALVPALVPPLVPALVPALVPPQCRLSAATRDVLVPSECRNPRYVSAGLVPP